MIKNLHALPIAGRFRVLLLVAIAAIVCALSLRFHFPGYFDPFAVSHIDHFVYVGMQYEGNGAFVRYLLDYPRPFGNVLLHHAARLGLEWQFAPVFAAYLLNLALLTQYLERLTKRLVALPSFILFAALIFANPEFYWGIKMDPLAVYSLTFLLGAAHAWQSATETGRRGYLLLTAILLLLATQTKESYFVVLGLFWMLQLLLLPRRRKVAVVMLLTSSLFMAFAVYRAVSWARDSGVAYEQSLEPAALVQGLLSLARLLFFPGLVAALAALTVVGWWRDRSVFLITVACVVFAVASLLPNASLPNHLFNHYAALGLLFVSAPVLLADRLAPSRPAWYAALAALGLLTYVAVLADQRPNIEGVAGWNRDQEQNMKRLVHTLTQMKKQTSPGESILVAGVMTPYNPFLASNFIKGELCGDCNWTTIVGSTVVPSRTSNVERIHASNARIFAKYDRLFVVAADGSLAGSYDGTRVLIMPPQQTELELSSSVRFFATPNPAPALPAGVAKTILHWTMPEGRSVEIRVGAPNGKVLAAGMSSGSTETGEWVQDGMLFFLQDASSGIPMSPDRTAAIVIMSVVPADRFLLR